MNAKLISTCITLLMLLVVAQDAACQTMKPVDISGFGKHHIMQASVADVSTSVCRVLQGDAFRHYDVHISGAVSFENHLRKPALLYKQAFVLTTRMAASPGDLASGRFITGFDGDRIGISSSPKRVSIEDFALVEAGKSYSSTVSTMVPLTVRNSIPSSHRLISKYWVQLGIDARPDAFYFDTRAQTEFSRKFETRGELIDFVLSKPFSVNLTLGANTPVCEE